LYRAILKNYRAYKKVGFGVTTFMYTLIMKKKVTRLLEQFAPNHYDLQLTIAEDKRTFSGSVTITGKKVGRPNKRITLHQKALKIKLVKLKKVDKNGKLTDFPIDRTNPHPAYDEFRIHTETDIYPGEYIIELEFSGDISKNMEGIYPCFFEHEGEQMQLIATQFESHHAREVFPCIDEPAAKATFQLTLLKLP
jgi:aminopeptidase N